MGGADIATVIAAAVTGIFSVLVILLPIVLGRSAVKKARENETHLVYDPGEHVELTDLVHRHRRELHLRLDDVEALIRRRACPFSDASVNDERAALLQALRQG